MLAEITRHSRFTIENFRALATEQPIDCALPGLFILTLRSRLREEAKPDAVRSSHDLLDVAPGQLLRARHGRGRTSQLGAHLPRNQGIYLRAVVLVVSQALVNLGPR
jgi:hypothetical protein